MIEETIKTDTAEKVIIKLKNGKKEEWKKFFGSKGKNLSEGIRMAVDYIIQEEREGKIIIVDSGIRKQ